MKHEVEEAREILAEVERLLRALSETLDHIAEPRILPSSHAASLQQRAIEERKQQRHDPNLGTL